MNLIEESDPHAVMKLDFEVPGRKERTRSVENVVPDKVGPDSSHNKIGYQLAPHKNSNRDPKESNPMLEPAQHTRNAAKTSHETWPGLQNNFRGDSDRMEIADEYEDAFKQAEGLHIKEDDIPR